MNFCGPISSIVWKSEWRPRRKPKPNLESVPLITVGNRMIASFSRPISIVEISPSQSKTKQLKIANNNQVQIECSTVHNMERCEVSTRIKELIESCNLSILTADGHHDYFKYIYHTYRYVYWISVRKLWISSGAYFKCVITHFKCVHFVYTNLLEWIRLKTVQEKNQACPWSERFIASLIFHSLYLWYFMHRSKLCITFTTITYT